MSSLPQDGGLAPPPATRGSYWKRLEVWLLLLLLLGFILPWVRLGAFFGGSGLQIAGLPFLLGDLFGKEATQDLWVLHLLYLLPLEVITALILAALGKASWRLAAALAGLVPWAALAYALSLDLAALAEQAGQTAPGETRSLFQVLDAGAYLSLLAGLLVVLRALGLLGRR